MGDRRRAIAELTDPARKEKSMKEQVTAAVLDNDGGYDGFLLQ